VKFITLSMILFAMTFALTTVRADTVNDLLDSARKNYEAKHYYKAIEDLEWAKKEMTNLHLQRLKTYLPEKVAGYSFTDSGGDVIGFKGLEREYKQESSSNTVKINLITGSAAAGTAGLGALLNMANLAAGMNPNATMVQAKGRKGNLVYEQDSSEAVLSFSLPNNVSLMITTNGFTSGDEAKKFADLIDFDGLEKEFQ
jgi:hypothetical protein